MIPIMGLVLVFYNSDLSFLASGQVVLMVHDPVGKYFPVAPGSDLWGAAAMFPATVSVAGVGPYDVPADD